MKHYKYRKIRSKAPDVRRPDSRTPAGSEERLTGQVQGKKASDLAERFANALSYFSKEYRFSVLVYTPFQIPGQANEVDFFVTDGAFVQPIEIDGEFSHKTAEQRADDQLRDQMLNPEIKKKWPGARDIIRVPGDKVQTRDDARNVVRSIF